MSDTANLRPTLAAVAARAGVSASTASLVFSGAGPVADATRARVLEAAAALGYAGPDPT
ncbi:MAG: LacI family DNA-binding transcriptional regulator, partial [Protaetiibacter sp.]